MFSPLPSWSKQAQKASRVCCQAFSSGCCLRFAATMKIVPMIIPYIALIKHIHSFKERQVSRHYSTTNTKSGRSSLSYCIEQSLSSWTLRTRVADMGRDEVSEETDTEELRSECWHHYPVFLCIHSDFWEACSWWYWAANLAKAPQTCCLKNQPKKDFLPSPL